jgi:molecular chaperone DnaK (HSP70)
VNFWQIAKRQGVVNPENTFFSVKRFIGSKMSDIDSEAKMVPYTVSDPTKLDKRLFLPPCSSNALLENYLTLFSACVR